MITSQPFLNEADLFLIREHLREFSCLGADCPDHCCGGWNVPVSISDRDRLAEHLSTEQMDNLNTKHGSQWVFKQKNGGCLAQCENGLCTIQQKFGHDSLPDVCASYPRFLGDWGSRKELGGFLSCPEIARIALSGDHAQLLSPLKEAPRAKTDISVNPKNGPYFSRFLFVREKIDEMLQENNFFHALHQVGAFVELSPAFFNQSSREDELHKLIDRSSNLGDSLPIDEEATQRLWTLIIAELRDFSEKHLRYVKPLERLKHMLQKPEIDSVKKFLQVDAQFCSTYEMELIPVWRRYMRHDWNIRWYLHSPDLRMHWEQMLFKWTLLRLFLISCCDSWKEELATCVYSVERLVEHTALKTRISSVLAPLKLPARKLFVAFLPLEAK